MQVNYIDPLMKRFLSHADKWLLMILAIIFWFKV